MNAVTIPERWDGALSPQLQFTYWSFSFLSVTTLCISQWCTDPVTPNAPQHKFFWKYKENTLKASTAAFALRWGKKNWSSSLQHTPRQNISRAPAVLCPLIWRLVLEDGCLSLSSLPCHLAQVQWPFFQGHHHQGLPIDQMLQHWELAESWVCVISVTITDKMREGKWSGMCLPPWLW